MRLPLPPSITAQPIQCREQSEVPLTLPPSAADSDPREATQHSPEGSSKGVMACIDLLGDESPTELDASGAVKVTVSEHSVVRQGSRSAGGKGGHHSAEGMSLLDGDLMGEHLCGSVREFDNSISELPASAAFPSFSSLPKVAVSPLIQIDEEERSSTTQANGLAVPAQSFALDNDAAWAQSWPDSSNMLPGSSSSPQAPGDVDDPSASQTASQNVASIALLTSSAPSEAMASSLGQVQNSFHSTLVVGMKSASDGGVAAGIKAAGGVSGGGGGGGGGGQTLGSLIKRLSGNGRAEGSDVSDEGEGGGGPESEDEDEWEILAPTAGSGRSGVASCQAQDLIMRILSGEITVLLSHFRLGRAISLALFQYLFMF